VTAEPAANPVPPKSTACPARTHVEGSEIVAAADAEAGVHAAATARVATTARANTA
jgi:hypothetical protein